MYRTYPGTVIGWLNGGTVDIRWTADCEATFHLDGIHVPRQGKPGYAEARALALALCPVGSTVGITPHNSDFCGRLLADVTTAHGGDVADILIDAGLGSPL